MKHFFLIYYAVAMFSSIIGIALVFVMVFQNLKRLAFVYGIFILAFSLLVGNILFQYYGYFILREVETPEKLWLSTLLVFMAKNLFLVGFGLVMVFLFGNRWWGQVIGSSEIFCASIGMLMAISWLIRGFSQKELLLLLFFDQWVWGSLLIVFLGLTLVFLWFYTFSYGNSMLTRVIRVFVGFTMMFLPFFVVDILWELFQIRWGILPRCFNFTPCYYMLGNFFIFIYMVRVFAEKESCFFKLVKPFSMKIDGIRLSRREQEIVSLLVQGDDNLTIASKLYIAEHTVRNYISKLYEKTKTSNRVQLVQTLINIIEKQEGKDWTKEET